MNSLATTSIQPGPDRMFTNFIRRPTALGLMSFARQVWPMLREPTAVILAMAAAVLALDPIAWLVNTWRDPAYDSNGLLIMAAVLGMAAWSVSSPIVASPTPISSRAIGLLGMSASLRLVGQLSAVNFLGALTLVADVYAIGLMLHIGERRRPLSPGWLAIVFAFSLPIERIFQRCLGYGLQLVSADGACRILRSGFESVVCEGVRIVIAGRDVLIDLPCSGARTLLLSVLAFTMACAILRPRRAMALVGFIAVLASALAANVLRIVLLALGLAFPSSIGGLDVMAAPWHDAIGYLSLTLGLLPLAAWMAMIGRPLSPSRPNNPQISQSRFLDGWMSPPVLAASRLPLAVATLILAVVIINLPRRPIDVAQRNLALAAPASIMGMRAEPIDIDAGEAAYFTQYGGLAVKTSYGSHSLMLVRTSSPLRHLHTPDECLRGIGFNVSYGGMSFKQVPTARYLATAPTGKRYFIDVTFVSDSGLVTGSVAGAVWHWLRGEAAQWTEIQRVSPADLPASDNDNFSAAALAALGIDPPLKPKSQPLKKG